MFSAEHWYREDFTFWTMSIFFPHAPLTLSISGIFVLQPVHCSVNPCGTNQDWQRSVTEPFPMLGARILHYWCSEWRVVSVSVSKQWIIEELLKHRSSIGVITSKAIIFRKNISFWESYWKSGMVFKPVQASISSLHRKSKRNPFWLKINSV